MTGKRTESNTNNNDKENIKIATHITPQTQKMIETILEIGTSLTKGEFYRNAVVDYIRRRYSDVYEKYTEVKEE